MLYQDYFKYRYKNIPNNTLYKAKTLNVARFTQAIINFIANNENTKENKIVITKDDTFTTSSDFAKSTIPANPANATVGTDKRKENLNASSLFYPKNNPCVVVIPLLLTPGIIDNVCINPIKKASINVKSAIVLFCLANKSER